MATPGRAFNKDMPAGHMIERRPTAESATEIVGRSVAFTQALKQAETVAATDSTVLILGETGTGKELVAQRIHQSSSRRNRGLIRADCAALPAGLIESELFGHERGAFTGAIARNVGRFELAHGGTLFLDEVGDIPLELQSKLLRVLQEQELERLGSTRTIRVDFRLVAATNKDLGDMVESGRFRRDLYYRLNVFPIYLPALRDRPGDIPLLVSHFLKKCLGRMGKKIDTVRPEDMERLCRHHWPGNIRELHNVIERSAILSGEGVLQLAAIPEEKRSNENDSKENQSLADAMRKHILQVLRDTEWVVAGPDGAAAKLGVKRTTLLDKMRRLGITRPKN